MTRCSRAKTGSCSSQFCHEPDSPWMKTTAVAGAQLDDVDPPPVDRHPALVLAPVDVQPGASGRRGRSRRARRAGVERSSGMPREDNRGPEGSRRMRIAIDIDSTLHHYWDELADAAKRRFGVELPYDHQHTWKISRLRDEQLRAVHRRHPLRRGHRPRRALSGRGRDRQRLARRRPLHPHHQPPRRALPPGDRALAGRHRPAATTSCTAPTTRSAAACEIDIDVLIDDSPVNLVRAIEDGIVGRDARAPVEPRRCARRRRRRQRRRLAGLAAALELRLPRLRRAA